jgi:hypothetical protein
MSESTSSAASKSTFELGQAQPLVEELKRLYGERTRIAAAKRPEGEGERDSKYRGYAVAIDEKYIAQRVDQGSIETSIVIHDRSQLTVPANSRTGQEAGIKRLLDRNERGVDLSIQYGKEGPGEVYGRNRDAENARWTAKKLLEASGLDGSKRASFERNLSVAAENYVVQSFDRLRSRGGQERAAEHAAPAREAAEREPQARAARAR